MKENITKKLQSEVAKKRESFLQSQSTVFEQFSVVQTIKKTLQKNVNQYAIVFLLHGLSFACLLRKA